MCQQLCLYVNTMHVLLAFIQFYKKGLTKIKHGLMINFECKLFKDECSILVVNKSEKKI